MKRIGCHGGRAATCVWLLGSAVSALGQKTTNLPANLPLPDLGFSVLRVLGALALVLAVFFAGIWLFRNWQRFVGRTGRAPKLGVLEVKALGNRHSLYVVGYERQRLLLASSPTGVTMVSQLPEATSDELSSPPQLGFAETLQHVLSTKS
jgi:flagellar biogenesis protein FliO